VGGGDVIPKAADGAGCSARTRRKNHTPSKLMPPPAGEPACAKGLNPNRYPGEGKQGGAASPAVALSCLKGKSLDVTGRLITGFPLEGRGGGRSGRKGGGGRFGWGRRRGGKIARYKTRECKQMAAKGRGGGHQKSEGRWAQRAPRDVGRRRGWGDLFPELFDGGI